MPQDAFIDLLKPGALIVAGILCSLAACTENAAGVDDDFAPVFWEQKDDFTEMNAYYLDAKIWIDREGGEYLDLQFQCFRHSGAQLSIDQNLIVNSSIEENRPYGSAAYLDAVLYKSKGEGPRVYRNGYEQWFRRLQTPHSTLETCSAWMKTETITAFSFVSSMARHL